jgi:hypothetical protein
MLCHATLDGAGLRAFAIVAGTDRLSRPFAHLTEHVAPIKGDTSQIPAIGQDCDRRSSKGDGSVARAAALRQTGHLQERLK